MHPVCISFLHTNIQIPGARWKTLISVNRPKTFPRCTGWVRTYSKDPTGNKAAPHGAQPAHQQLSAPHIIHEAHSTEKTGGASSICMSLRGPAKSMDLARGSLREEIKI